jgi:hypothetical protein
VGATGSRYEVRRQPLTPPHLQSLAGLQGSAGVTGSAAAAATATPSTVAALVQIGLRVAALAQIYYMASGSGNAPAGDGTLHSPLSLLFMYLMRVHTQ